MVVSVILERNPELEFQDKVDLDKLVKEAFHDFQKDQSRLKEMEKEVSIIFQFKGRGKEGCLGAGKGLHHINSIPRPKKPYMGLLRLAPATSLVHIQVVPWSRLGIDTGLTSRTSPAHSIPGLDTVWAMWSHCTSTG